MHGHIILESATFFSHSVIRRKIRTFLTIQLDMFQIPPCSSSVTGGVVTDNEHGGVWNMSEQY